MDVLTQKVYNELGWFIGKNVEFTSVLLSDNDMERYYKGTVHITLFESKGYGYSDDIIDVEVRQNGYHGVTIEATLLNDFEIKSEQVNGFMQKTLIISLTDGSSITLTYLEEESDLTDPTDIDIPDAYMRYLLHLPLKLTRDLEVGETYPSMEVNLPMRK